MPCPRIFHNTKPMDRLSGVLPMAEHDRAAWAETRRLHPQYYEGHKA